MNIEHETRRFELRKRTSAAHEALDRMIGSFSSAEAYVSYLTGMAAFRTSIEPRLDALPASLNGWQPSRISALLAADLADVGQAPPPPVPLGTLALGGSGAYGALYVLEGSALGARLLYRRAKDIGFSETHGARHLARQSASLDAWRGLLVRLEEVEPFDMSEATAAANATFTAATRAFENRIAGATA